MNNPVYLLLDRIEVSPSALTRLIKCRLKECEEKLLCDQKSLYQSFLTKVFNHSAAAAAAAVFCFQALYGGNKWRR